MKNEEIHFLRVFRLLNRLGKPGLGSWWPPVGYTTDSADQKHIEVSHI